MSETKLNEVSNALYHDARKNEHDVMYRQGWEAAVTAMEAMRLRPSTAQSRDAERYRLLHNGDVPGIMIIFERAGVELKLSAFEPIDGEQLDGIVDAARSPDGGKGGERG